MQEVQLFSFGLIASRVEFTMKNTRDDAPRHLQYHNEEQSGESLPRPCMGGGRGGVVLRITARSIPKKVSRGRG